MSLRNLFEEAKRFVITGMTYAGEDDKKGETIELEKFKKMVKAGKDVSEFFFVDKKSAEKAIKKDLSDGNTVISVWV